jgi:hypothetical protein
VDGNEVVIEKLLIKPVGMTMTMRADCPSCKRKIVESRYESRHEYNIKRDKWRDNIRACPYCGVIFRGAKKEKEKRLAWASFKGGMSARAKNGEFTVTKSGRRWIWTFRYYSENETRAENQGGAFSKEVAQRVCEKHKEWMV